MPRNARPAALPVFACCALWCAMLLAGCGGRNAQPLAAAPGSPAPVTTEPAAQPARPAQPGAMPQLPGLDALAAGKSASATDADRFRLGSNFLTGQANAHVSASGSALDFAPQWNQAGPHDVSQAALALFELQLGGMAGAQNLTFNWADPPKSFSNLYIGLSNYSTNRWEWFAGSAAPLALTGLDPYRTGDGRTFVAVLLLGAQPAQLSWLKAGGNIMPQAALASPADTGVAPYDAPVDASASFDPDGTIAAYDYDYDNDGTYEALNAGPQHTVTYVLPGDRTCTVRVTDNQGGQDTASVVIHVQVPSGPPTARLTADYVFHDEPGSVTLDASASTAPLGVARYEWDLDGNGSYETDGGLDAYCTYNLAAGGQQVGVRVTDTIAQASTATLALYGDSDGYDEVEDNDTYDTGNQLPGPNIQGFEGNLGDSGTNDGDLDDWYKVTISAPVTVQFNLLFIDADADLDLRLIDTDGVTQLGASSGTVDNERITYAFSASGTYYIRAFRYGTTFSDADYTLDFKVLAPPSVSLDADVTSGASPLTVNFTAIASGAGGATITKYQWDFNGDGTFELDTLTSPSTAQTYISGGVHNATVKVTDSNGAVATAQRPVTVNVTYSEQENNDSADTAQQLPAIDFTGFTGNIGAGGALDGDSDDWYRFSASAGQELGFVCSFSSSEADIDLRLVGADKTTVLQTSAGTDDDEFVMFTAPGAGPFFLEVIIKDGASLAGPADYQLSGLLFTLNESEPNDPLPSSNDLPAFPFTKFGGHLETHIGTQDPCDFYKITIATPGPRQLWLRFIDDDMDTDFKLFMDDGITEIGSSTGTDNDERIAYDFAAPGTYYLKVYNYALGPADYILQGR